MRGNQDSGRNAAHALAARLLRVIRGELSLASGPFVTSETKRKAARIAAAAMAAEAGRPDFAALDR